MKDTVVIKSSKSGMMLILDPEAEFQDLVGDIARKFRDSSSFWGTAQVVLTLEGRNLSSSEELEIVNTITGNSQIHILCLSDTDAERIRNSEKLLHEKLMDLSTQTGQFYKGNLKSGDTLEAETSIVVTGDVSPGARIISKGSVIVLGQLSGTVHAGAAGDVNAVVASLDFDAKAIKIGGRCRRFFHSRNRLEDRAVVAVSDTTGIILKSICQYGFPLP